MIRMHRKILLYGKDGKKKTEKLFGMLLGEEEDRGGILNVRQ